MIAGLAVGSGPLVSLLPLAFLGLGFLGRPWPSGPVWPIALVVLVVVLIAWLAVELPMRRLRTATRSSD